MCNEANVQQLDEVYENRNEQYRREVNNLEKETFAEKLGKPHIENSTDV